MLIPRSEGNRDAAQRSRPWGPGRGSVSALCHFSGSPLISLHHELEPLLLGTPLSAGAARAWGGGDAGARRGWALREAEVSSFYSNCACSELLLGPGETSHGHREPHKAARRLLGAGTHALWQKQVGPGCAWYLFALDVLGHHRCGYCWKLPEELGAGPEGPAPSACCLFTRMGGLGPAGSPPAVPQVGEGPRISAEGTSGCNLGGSSCGDRQATCRASRWSRYTAVYLGWSVCRDTGGPYTPRLCLPRMRPLGLAWLLCTNTAHPCF